MLYIFIRHHGNVESRDQEFQTDTVYGQLHKLDLLGKLYEVVVQSINKFIIY